MVPWEGYLSDDAVGIVAPVIVYWLYAGLYHILDSLHIKALESHRLHPKEDVDKKNLVTMEQVVKGVLFQQLIQMVVGSLLLYLDPTASSKTEVPSLLVCCLQFGAGMAIMDTYQYFMHRWFHQNKFLYRHLHSWHHRLQVPYACGALYNHPVEGLLMDTVGGALSFLLSGMHPRVAVFFWSFATMKTVDDHCGFLLTTNPFQFFFQNNAPYHDVHHQMPGFKYNFSQPFFPIWDHILGTHMPYSLEPRPEGGVQVKIVARPLKSAAPPPAVTAVPFAGEVSVGRAPAPDPDETSGVSTGVEMKTRVVSRKKLNGFHEAGVEAPKNGMHVTEGKGDAKGDRRGEGKGEFVLAEKYANGYTNGIAVNGHAMGNGHVAENGHV
eukprot:TRINITY_DN23424_c0_g1_i1.p1 TRINITY_DN23424_c0_g1~~TRINITY_DN23424_c0_g1_i1.p1  ORF type:complete len:381 (-),score=79.95 TRINITY_DN23424_c0_g1_i1:184-1326(-)